MEYLTVNSKLRLAIRGFTKQEDVDGATFKLQRTDSQKMILDQASAKVTKTATAKQIDWEIAIDDAVLGDTLTDDEMQCKVSVSFTAAGKTWIPTGQQYILYRNKVTVTATDKDGAKLKGARCTCAIRKPADYHAESDPGSGMTRKAPNSVITKEDGTAEISLDSPGLLNLEWAFPYYPQDNAAWTAMTSAKRETVLLERERKARFIWPLLARGEEQKHFVNLKPEPISSDRGRKLSIEVGREGGLAGDKIYLTVGLTSPDTKDAAGETLKCEIEGDLEIGAEKKTITLTLDADNGTRRVELDFKGYGGITAALGVSTVEGSIDETVKVTSWRKVDVQPYYPATGFFGAAPKLPDALEAKIKEAFDEVFIEVEFLPARLLGTAFPGIEQPAKFDIVTIPEATARAAGLVSGDVSSTGGGGPLVCFKTDGFPPPIPLEWIMQFAGPLAATPQPVLHAIFTHGCYETRAVGVSLILSGEKPVSEPQPSVFVLSPRNFENHGSPLLPWGSKSTSYWEVVGEATRGDVTMDFIEINADKARLGEYEYKIKLPEHGTSKKLASEGKKIKLNVNLRGYEFGAASGSRAPFFYVSLDADEASVRSAYAVIHELAHTLGFAPKDGESFYSVSGSHCANGMKTDAESFVREKQGTVGATVGDTLDKGLPGRNVPSELAAAGKFGTCVMWGHTHRQKSTDALFSGALKFCSSCAPLMRVTAIGAIVGGES